jgi:hypothetical protein
MPFSSSARTPTRSRRAEFAHTGKLVTCGRTFGTFASALIRLMVMITLEGTPKFWRVLLFEEDLSAEVQDGEAAHYRRWECIV